MLTSTQVLIQNFFSKQKDVSWYFSFNRKLRDGLMFAPQTKKMTRWGHFILRPYAAPKKVFAHGMELSRNFFP